MIRLIKWLWEKFTGAPFEGGVVIDLDAEEEGRKLSEKWIEKK